MRLLQNIILPTLILFSLSAHSTQNEGLLSGINAEAYTISSALIRSESDIDPNTIKIKTAIGEKVKLNYYQGSNNKNNLVILLSGLGDDGQGALSNFLAVESQKRGFTSIVLPSIFSGLFSKNISTSSYVGLATPDTTDMIQFIDNVVDSLEKKTNLVFHRQHLMGYSLGALTAAHISARRPQQFSKVILINSPVDLRYGLTTLDRFKEQRVSLSTSKFKLKLDWFIQLRKFLKRPLDTASVYEFSQGLPEELADKQYIIGDILGGALKSVVASIEKRTDTKISSKNLSFINYLNDVLIPYYQNLPGQGHVNFSFINSSTSLSAIEGHLYSSKNIYMFHNSDDFLLRDQEDTDYLHSIFRGRMTLYPNGGHLGNVWLDTNLNDIFNTL